MPDDVGKRMGLMKGTTDLAAVADADLIIEAVFEDMGVKSRRFSPSSTSIAKPGAILATNTSYLDVNVIARIDRAAGSRARPALLQPRRT